MRVSKHRSTKTPPLAMFKSRKSTNSLVSPLASPNVAVTRPTYTNDQFSSSGSGRSPNFTSGAAMDRFGSYNSDSVKTEKTEKRRSGFFGLGKKEKEKDTAKEVSREFLMVICDVVETAGISCAVGSL